MKTSKIIAASMLSLLSGLALAQSIQEGTSMGFNSRIVQNDKSNSSNLREEVKKEVMEEQRGHSVYATAMIHGDQLQVNKAEQNGRTREDVKKELEDAQKNGETYTNAWGMQEKY